jgi:hypothetical protein
MLDENRTPRRFWADAISTACYISNRIFLHSILNLTPFELRFRHKSSVPHLKPFVCKCFVLKHDNLDKFESRSSGGILLGYTPHGRSYRVFNLETNTLLSHVMRPLMKLFVVLMMSLSVQVTRKWRRASL